jgi:hypothetical protein
VIEPTPATGPATDPPTTPAAPRIRNHRRFALTEVTFEAEPVGGATVDTWFDEAGTPRWFVRVLMPSRDTATGGELAGRMRDGRIVRGTVLLVGLGPAPHSRGPVLVEWRGVGSLRADGDLEGRPRP